MWLRLRDLVDNRTIKRIICINAKFKLNSDRKHITFHFADSNRQPLEDYNDPLCPWRPDCCGLFHRPFCLYVTKLFVFFCVCGKVHWDRTSKHYWYALSRRRFLLRRVFARPFFKFLHDTFKVCSSLPYFLGYRQQVQLHSSGFGQQTQVRSVFLCRNR